MPSKKKSDKVFSIGKERIRENIRNMDYESLCLIFEDVLFNWLRYSNNISKAEYKDEEVMKKSLDSLLAACKVLGKNYD